MIVRCIKTEITDSNKELKNSGWWHVDGYLTIGKEYDVYAIHHSWYGAIPGYMVYVEEYDDVCYVPSCFFEILDSEKPSFWCVSQESPDYEGPPELGPDRFEAIVDGEAEAIASFTRIRTLMTDLSMFEYIERGEMNNLQKERTGNICVIIDENICGASNLIDTIYRGIDNKYSGHSWDGLYEALETPGWITNRTICLVHLALPVLDEKDQGIYLSLLCKLCKAWKEEHGREMTEYLNIEMHFYFLRELRKEIEVILYKELLRIV